MRGRVARINEKHRHGHHVAQLGAGVIEGLFDIAEGLAKLSVEIACQRFPGIVNLAGMASDKDGAARPLGNDRRRERPLLLPGASDE